MGALRRHPVALLMPLLCSSLLSRLFFFTSHRILGREHLAVELFLYFVSCFPVSLFTGVVLARIFVHAREGRRPSLADASEMLRAPGVVATTFRLVLRLLLWATLVMATMGVLLILAVAVAGFALKAAHHGAKMSLPHGWGFGYIYGSFLVFAVLFSRYSFVLPLFAKDAGGTRESFNRHVALARARFPTLSVLNVVEYALALGADHVLRPFEKDGSLRAVAIIGVRLLLTSGMTTCFELLKAELAFLAVDVRAVSAVATVFDSHSSWLEIGS